MPTLAAFLSQIQTPPTTNQQLLKDNKLKMAHQANKHATIGIANIATTIKTSGVASEMTPLATDFQPSPCDVICRRGKTAFNHNKHFRELIQKHLEKYSQASSKLEKSLVVSDVVDTIRAGSPLGGFVRAVDGIWYEVGDAIAREKVGGAFRDMLHTQYKSSTKAKKRRRQETQDSSSVEGSQVTKVSTPEPVASTPEPDTKRRRVEFATTTTLPPLSPKTSKVLCAFGDLLKDIASRKQELARTPQLEIRKPTLPPPARFPSAPKSISLLRGCSVESAVSFDLNEMDEMDEFDLGLSRFTSVASAASIFSFQAPIL